MTNLPIIPSSINLKIVEDLSLKWGFPIRPANKNDPLALEYKNNTLQLINLHNPKLKPFYIDFTSKPTTYRRISGGGRKQAIAKAIGLKRNLNPTVLDLTAGLGKDAFVLASLGCQVHMVERSKVIAALLEDGLKRARENKELKSWVSKRLSFTHQDSLKELPKLPFTPDVVYLDPMYPEKTKTALVKKDMQILHTIIGKDKDADQLLPIALKLAKNRIIVKRPAQGKHLNNTPPNTSLKTKNNRFDIYLIT